MENLMDLTKTSIAFAVVLLGTTRLPAQNQVSLTVDATMDIYRAGGYNDGSNGIAPAVFSFPARAWRTMTITSNSGAWSCNSVDALFGADGTTSSASGCTPGDITPVGTFAGYDSTDF